MTDNPRVPVRERCQSVHGVLTARPLDRDDVWELPPESLLRRFGASAQDLARIADRPHVRLVHGSASTADAAAMVVAVRREALELARENDGVVLDLAVPRVVRIEEPDLAVARQWVALDLDGDEVRSIGLEAFGLPEISCPGVSVDATPATLAVLMGLSHRLIDEWPANDPIGPAVVTLRDIAHGFGDAEAPVTSTDKGLAVGIDLDVERDVLAITLLDDPHILFS